MVIHGDKLRSLLWLRYKLFTRSLTRSRASSIIGGIFFALFILIFGGGLALVTCLGYRSIPAPANAEVLFLVLTCIYLLWIVLPLLQVNTNEGLDLSKLTLFPLTRGEIMLSLIFSTLLDPMTLALVLLLGAVILGWGTSIPLALLALLAVIVFYVQLIGMSQLVLALLQSALQRRRLRDFSIILTALLASTGYLCQFAIRGLGNTGFSDSLRHGTFSHYLQWLPPGMAAQSIQQAARGNWGASFAWLGVLTVISIVILYLWQIFVQRRLATADEGGSVAKSVRYHHTASAVAVQERQAPRTWISILPPQVSAMMIKDLKYLWRDPQIKGLLLRSLLPIVFLVIYPMLQNSKGSLTHIYGFTELYVPNIVLLSLFTLAYNALGFEQQSLATLFLFPIEPKHLLWGKNLTLFLLGMVEVLVLSTVIAAFTQGWNLLVPTLTLGLSGITVMLAVGNVISIFFPQRPRMAARGFRTTASMSTGQGCLLAVMSLVALVVILIVLLPVILGVTLPFIYRTEAIWAITIPASLLYSAVIYFVVTMLVAPRMLDRAPEILAMVIRE